MSFWPFATRPKRAQQEQQRSGPPVVVPYAGDTFELTKSAIPQPRIADRDGPAVPEVREAVREGMATITDAARSRVISAPPEVQRQAPWLSSGTRKPEPGLRPWPGCWRILRSWDGSRLRSRILQPGSNRVRVPTGFQPGSNRGWCDVLPLLRRRPEQADGGAWHGGSRCCPPPCRRPARDFLRPRSPGSPCAHPRGGDGGGSH